jgi:Ca2+-binding EF-hand superfamily protein
LIDLFKGAGVEVSEFEIKVLLYMAGVDETGEISSSQFAAVDAKTSEEDFDPEEVLRAVFRAADKDGTGSLSKDDIRQTMINECHMLTEDEFQGLIEQIKWAEGDINWEEFLARFKSMFS